MIIGLTGGIGSGKTTVAAMLAEFGAVIIDTDLIAREVVEPPSSVLDAIRGEFGAQVINADGTLDRSALGRIAFQDEAKRQKLNELTHPAILKRILALMGQQPANAVVVVVVPLLFESRFEKNCETVIAVVASPDVRRRRLIARADISTAEIDARMRAQMDDAEHERRADVAIHNDGDLKRLRADVALVWTSLNQAAGSSASPRPKV